MSQTHQNERSARRRQRRRRIPRQDSFRRSGGGGGGRVVLGQSGEKGERNRERERQKWTTEPQKRRSQVRPKRRRSRRHLPPPPPQVTPPPLFPSLFSQSNTVRRARSTCATGGRTPGRRWRGRGEGRRRCRRRRRHAHALGSSLARMFLRLSTIWKETRELLRFSVSHCQNLDERGRHIPVLQHLCELDSQNSWESTEEDRPDNLLNITVSEREHRTSGMAWHVAIINLHPWPTRCNA